MTSEAQYETQPRPCGIPSPHAPHTRASGHACPGLGAKVAPHGRTSDLTEFLLARIGEDEVGLHVVDMSGQTISLHPHRMSLECDIKRQIVGVHRGDWGNKGNNWECRLCTKAGTWCTTLAVMALPYASHPDYRTEWRP